MLTGMMCPHCEAEMRPGRLRVRGSELSKAAVEWEPPEVSKKRAIWFDPLRTRSRGARLVLDPDWFGHRTRRAWFCPRCGAVLTGPYDDNEDLDEDR
jgi:hypothetical protein